MTSETLLLLATLLSVLSIKVGGRHFGHLLTEKGYIFLNYQRAQAAISLKEARSKRERQDKFIYAKILQDTALSARKKEHPGKQFLQAPV